MATLLGRAARRRSPGQRGMTMIELVIAMLIGALLITLVLAIYTRMSVAYRTQNVVSEVQQTLRAANDAITLDVRRAGFMVPNSFRVTSDIDPNPISAVRVTNDLGNEGPDAIRVFFADASAVAHITSITSTIDEATVDDVDAFTAGDLVVIAMPMAGLPSPSGGAEIAQYDSCVVQVTDTPDATTIAFADAGNPFNTNGNIHCESIKDATNATTGTMMYRFVGRSYRIDPNAAREDLGVLQVSPSGELLPDDWADIGVGFTDMQLASRYFEDADGADVDGDGEPTRDWYSSAAQNDPDLSGVRPANAVITQVTLSLAARSPRELSVVSTAKTPAFVGPNDPTDRDHNQLGDAPEEDVDGNFVYRWSTTRIDVRNMGVGR